MQRRGGGGITILSKKVFVSEGRNKIVGSRTLQFPRKFLAWKIFMHSRGYHDFPEYFYFTIFLSHRIEKLLRPTLLCFKKFQYRTFWCIGDGRIMVLSKLFVSPDQKTSEGSFLCFRSFLVKKKIWLRDMGMGEEYQDFGSSDFCLTVPKKVGDEPFRVSKKVQYRTFS